LTFANDEDGTPDLNVAILLLSLLFFPCSFAIAELSYETNGVFFCAAGFSYYALGVATVDLSEGFEDVTPPPIRSLIWREGCEDICRSALSCGTVTSGSITLLFSYVEAVRESFNEFVSSILVACCSVKMS